MFAVWMSQIHDDSIQRRGASKNCLISLYITVNFHGFDASGMLECRNPLCEAVTDEL